MEQGHYTENVSRLIQPFDYTDPTIGCVTPLVCIQNAPVVVRGELTLVCGPKKTYKSNLCQCLAASLLGGSPENCVGFSSPQPGSKFKVLLIDTEQSKPDFRGKCLSILSRAGLPETQRDKNLHTFSWRGEDPDEMVKALPILIKQERPDVVIIDGIADLVNDINSISESRRLSGLILKLAEEQNCGIVTVIHVNPTNSKERGHLGTWLANKAYGYVSLTQKCGVVEVSAERGCRGKAFQKFSIVYDESIHGVTIATQRTEKALNDALPKSKASKQKDETPSANKTAEQEGKKLTPKELSKRIPEIITASGKRALPANSIIDALKRQYGVKNATSARRAIEYALKSQLIEHPKKNKPYSLPAPQLKF